MHKSLWGWNWWGMKQSGCQKFHHLLPSCRYFAVVFATSLFSPWWKHQESLYGCARLSPGSVSDGLAQVSTLLNRSQINDDPPPRWCPAVRSIRTRWEVMLRGWGHHTALFDLHWLGFFEFRDMGDTRTHFTFSHQWSQLSKIKKMHSSTNESNLWCHCFLKNK